MASGELMFALWGLSTAGTLAVPYNVLPTPQTRLPLGQDVVCGDEDKINYKGIILGNGTTHQAE